MELRIETGFQTADNIAALEHVQFTSKDVIAVGDFNSTIFSCQCQNDSMLVKMFPAVSIKIQQQIVEDFEKMKKISQHVNLVSYIFCKLLANSIWLGMPFCGINLESYVEENKFIMPKQDILRQMSLGLQYLHSQNLVHGNLKPSNVLISLSLRQVKLSDFGLLNLYSDLIKRYIARTIQKGVFDWTAPEILSQYEKKNFSIAAHSFQSDAFSLGCLFFYVISDGLHPFGQFFERTHNILKNHSLIREGQIADCGQTALPITTLMISNKPEDRPGIVNIAHNVALWVPEQIMTFLKDVHELSCVQEDFRMSLQKLEVIHLTCNKNAWPECVNTKILDFLRKENFAVVNSVSGLISAIVYLNEAYKDFPDIMDKFPCMYYSSKNAVSYFASAFPYFCELVYLAISKFRSHERLRRYYEHCHIPTKFLNEKCPVLESSQQETAPRDLETIHCDANQLPANALSLKFQTEAQSVLQNKTRLEVQNLRVELAEKVYKLGDILDCKQLMGVQEWFCKNPKYTLKSPDMVLKLLRNTFPPKYPDYIPRFVSRQMVISPSLFEIDCTDIFVFTEIQLFELRQYCVSYNIDTSTSQLLLKTNTCRFVLLQRDAHFERITAKVSVPVHLIRYESTTNEFILEKTYGTSDFLLDHLVPSVQNYKDVVSEDDLVEIIARNETEGFSICGSPGMGKSLLLSSVATKVSKKCSERICAYIFLRDLNTSKLWLGSDAKSVLLEYLSRSSLGLHLLKILTPVIKPGFDLFFDGLDEIESENLNEMVHFLGHIKAQMPETRIFITSRPFLRKELLQITHHIPYDILPFDQETQVNFLTSAWTKRFPSTNVNALNNFARECLKEINSLMEKGFIVGVPLLCKLITQAFEDEAFAYAHHATKSSQVHFDTTSLIALYAKYINKQLAKSLLESNHDSSRKQCDNSDQLRSFHVMQAFKFVFPNFMPNYSEHEDCFIDLSNEEILNPGVINTVDGQNWNFVHRTFAEYLVAIYVVKAFFAKPELESLDKNTDITNELINLNDLSWLRQSAVANFVNAYIEENLATDTLSLRVVTENMFSRKNIFDLLFTGVTNGYDAILNIVLNTKLSLPNWNPILREGEERISFRILKYAVKNCNINTLKSLERFYLNYFNFNLLMDFSGREEYIWIVRDAIRRADCEIALLLVETVSLETHGFLIQCLEKTYIEHEEIVEKRLDVARLLLSKCPSLIVESWKSFSGPLAADKLHFKVIKFLVETHADVQATNSFGRTFLHNVAVLQNISKEEIFSLCCSVFIGRSTRDLLFVFCRELLFNFKFPFRQARALIQILNIVNTNEIVSESQFTSVWNSGVYTENNDSLSALSGVLINPIFYRVYRKEFVRLCYLALHEEDLPVINLLIQHDDVFLETSYKDNKTLLLMAVECKQVELFMYLYSRSANIFAIDRHGKSILHIAAETKDCEIFEQVVSLLTTDSLQKSKNVTISSQSSSKIAPNNLLELLNWPNKIYLQTPLHSACQYLDMPVQTLELFLACGPPVNDSNFKYTLININALDLRKENALMKALKSRRQLGLINSLVNYGANWTLQNKYGCNVAHICVQYGLLEHLKYFVELGCDVNHLDSEENNALQCGLKNYVNNDFNIELAKYLIQMGTSLENKNESGKTSYDIAVQNKFPADILNLLLPHTASTPIL